MSNVTVKVNYEGVGALLKSQDIMNICKKVANDVAGNYGGDCEISEHVGENRVNVSIGIPLADADSNDLLRAL